LAGQYKDGWNRVPDQQLCDNAFKVQWELFLRHVVKDEAFPWTLKEGAKGVQLAELALDSGLSASGWMCTLFERLRIKRSAIFLGFAVCVWCADCDNYPCGDLAGVVTNRAGLFLFARFHLKTAGTDTSVTALTNCVRRDLNQFS